MEASTDWKMGGGGGQALQPLPPQISEILFGTGRRAQKCYILRDQTTGDLKSHHLQARVTLTALSVPPLPPFVMWVIRYHN